MLALAACGPAAIRPPAPTPIPFITPPATAVTTSPSAEPASPPPLPARPTAAPTLGPPPTTPPVAAAAAPPPPAPVMSRTLFLSPVGGSGVSGTLAIVNQSGAFTATVAVHGIANGSLHTVHIHLGSCSNPYGGMHLTMIGLITGDSMGTGGVSARIAPVYLSSGHYVIVYGTSSPMRIIACANLAAM